MRGALTKAEIDLRKLPTTMGEWPKKGRKVRVIGLRAQTCKSGRVIMMPDTTDAPRLAGPDFLTESIPALMVKPEADEKIKRMATAENRTWYKDYERYGWLEDYRYSSFVYIGNWTCERALYTVGQVTQYCDHCNGMGDICTCVIIPAPVLLKDELFIHSLI